MIFLKWHFLYKGYYHNKDGGFWQWKFVPVAVGFADILAVKATAIKQMRYLRFIAPRHAAKT